MSALRTGCTFLIAVFAVATALAQVPTYVLMPGGSGIVNHYPGADGLVGTGDDVVSHEITTIVGSDPNHRGMYSHALYDPTFNSTSDPALPGTYIAVSFVQGTIDVDEGVAAAGGTYVVTGADITGTATGQGTGDVAFEFSSSDLSAGSFAAGAGARVLSLTGDFRITAFGNTVTVSGVTFTGTGVYETSLGSPSGSNPAYVNSVLVPRALALGANRLFYAELTGTLTPSGSTTPLLIIPVDVSLRLVAIDSTSASSDLSVTKSSDATGMVAAGDPFSYTIGVSNSGPDAASGVAVFDPLPPGVNYVSNTCSAPAPAAGLFTWSVGGLGSGGSTSCDVSVTVDGAANMNHFNGAGVYGDQFDPDLTNNTAMDLVENLQVVDEGLDQSPDSGASFFVPSDADCGLCATGAQVLADNFKVEEGFTVQQIEFWGGYSDNSSPADSFTIEIRDDNRASEAPGAPGVPGSLVATVGGPVSRSATGGNFGGFTEYRYSVGASVALPRGSYWLIVYNDISGREWLWEAGNPDPDGRSLTNVAFNTTAPPQVKWGPGDPGNELSIRMLGIGAQQAGIPALQWSGIGLLVVLLAGFGWAMLRTRGLA
jgi:uncharacterized repeat protein (TIGR01451 family)